MVCVVSWGHMGSSHSCVTRSCAGAGEESALQKEDGVWEKKWKKVKGKTIEEKQ